MCHHFRLLNEARLLAKQFKATIADDQLALPFGDFYPLNQVPVIRIDDLGEREIVLMEWGLLPFWWRPSGKQTSRKAYQRKCFNARGETIDTKPTFRAAFKSRRCLIPATEFMEKGHYFHLPENELFAFAGLWEHWQWDGETVESCTIVTTTPNAEVQEVGHHRMPVALTKDNDLESWLDSEIVEREALERLLLPSADGTFQTRKTPE
ncbi:SOS response-associated peptidase [Bythopirellula polymerisocia]|uniref:Abasic site processing protein n=1 Tax=Bythopirellula polymerisocia TaxID=2528003 RepID=A0A5C6CRF3_9BACT|nr:SOS response-associated peptidase [Bythopirellula polymerisocia]TWU25686.1 hypothetical protein Pla144_28950 [Bythopirellula polymerisocia]